MAQYISLWTGSLDQDVDLMSAVADADDADSISKIDIASLAKRIFTESKEFASASELARYRGQWARAFATAAKSSDSVLCETSGR